MPKTLRKENRRTIELAAARILKRDNEPHRQLGGPIRRWRCRTPVADQLDMEKCTK
jgi:hypothetical protein